MNDTVRLALTGPLGALILVTLVVLLVATELLMFFQGRTSQRVRAVTGGVSAVLGVAIIAQVIVRLL